MILINMFSSLNLWGFPYYINSTLSPFFKVAVAIRSVIVIILKAAAVATLLPFSEFR